MSITSIRYAVSFYDGSTTPHIDIYNKLTHSALQTSPTRPIHHMHVDSFQILSNSNELLWDYLLDLFENGIDLNEDGRITQYLNRIYSFIYH